MTDYIFDAHDVDSANQPDQGVLKLELSISGYWLGTQHSSDVMEITLSIHGEFAESVIIEADPFEISTSLSSQVGTSFPVFIPETVGIAWIKWSNIGDIDFTISNNNIAGERPLDWAGDVYCIKKLVNKIVVYGSGGVSILLPMENAFGLNTIYRSGIKGKNAVTGDDTKHFFIDSIGQLWRVDESLTKLDYSEFLSTLSSSLVMTYDSINNFIYICDGVKGYIYNVKGESLGKCQNSISGLGIRGSTVYIASPTTLSNPVFNVCTNTYDFGSRDSKVLTEVNVGVNTGKALSVAIDYRRDKSASFVTSSWSTVDKKGRAVIPCYGVEFRFRLKAAENEDFKVDYLQVIGGINTTERRPVNWEEIFCIKKLNDSIILYGNLGIAILTDLNEYRIIHDIKIKNKNAIAGDERVHFVLDSNDKLWKLSDGLKLLDYSEFISTLTDAVLFFENKNNLLYISDSTSGYVYSVDSDSFGKCYNGLTGIGIQGDTLYCTANDDLIVNPFNICTDVYDMWTRKLKTVHMIEIGTDVNTNLFASIDFRIDYKSDFVSLPWFPVTRDGICYINCTGVEFRFRVKSLEYKYFEVDYIRVYRTIHDYGIDNGFNFPTVTQ